jgi:hypothetical protein
MMSFSSRHVAEGRGVPGCPKRHREAEKRLALNERNGARQRRSDRPCQRLALYQAANKASRKIVASGRLAGHARTPGLIYGAGPARSDQIADFGFEVNDHNKGLRGRCRHRRQSLPADDHHRGRASDRTSNALCDQRAQAIVQADLLTGARAMVPIATRFSRWARSRSAPNGLSIRLIALSTILGRGGPGYRAHGGAPAHP